MSVSTVFWWRLSFHIHGDTHRRLHGGRWGKIVKIKTSTVLKMDVDVSKCWKRMILLVTCLDFVNCYEVKDNTINYKIIFYFISTFLKDWVLSTVIYWHEPLHVYCNVFCISLIKVWLKKYVFKGIFPCLVFDTPFLWDDADKVGTSSVH